MTKLARTIFARVFGRPFLRALIFPFFVVLMFAYAADASTDWQAARREVAAMPPGSKTAVFTLLFSVWAVTVGRALNPIWDAKSVAFLRRQPLSSWQWVMLLVPSLAISLVPTAFMWWLASLGREPLAHYLGFLGFPLVIGVALSRRGARPKLTAASAIALLASLMYLYWLYPLVGYLAAFLTSWLLQLAVSVVLREGPRTTPSRTSWLGASSACGALCLRDWRCLIRTRASAPVEMLVLAAIASLMMLAFRVNGGVRQETALYVACVLYLIAGSTAYRNLEIIKTRLGDQLMRAGWPISYLERGIALALFTGLLMSPAILPLAVIGATMGPGNLAVFFLFIAMTWFLTAALFVFTLRTHSSSVGLYINLCVLEGLVVYALPLPGFMVVVGACVFISLVIFRSGLATFASSEARSTMA